MIQAKRIAITGATGFIGCQVVEQLVQAGKEVLVLTRPGSNLFRLEFLNLLQKVEIARIDLNSLEAMRAEFERFKPETVLHLASYGVRSSDQDIDQTLNTNVTSAYKLLQAANGTVPRVVMMGSGFEYLPNPDGPISETAERGGFTLYGASKAAVWELGKYVARNTKLEVVNARLFTCYGPYENLNRLYPFVITRTMQGIPMDMSSGLQTRDYLYVDDAISGLFTVADKGKTGEAYNICSNLAVSVRDIAGTIQKVLGSGSDLIKWGARVERDFEPKVHYGNNSKLKALGWSPSYSLYDGVAKTVESYQKHQATWKLFP